ncbi:MAG: hypothetical protein MK207_14525 [Saprospiraceae bacterium]|nr:hypothetical protein [Saprospiraceae bacterium]
MKPTGNQEEFQRRLAMYLDGALSNEEASEFMTDIKNSPEQLAKLQNEKSFREFLRKKVSRHSVSPTLINSIKSKINPSH